LSSANTLISWLTCACDAMHHISMNETRVYLIKLMNINNLRFISAINYRCCFAS